MEKIKKFSDCDSMDSAIFISENAEFYMLTNMDEGAIYARKYPCNISSEKYSVYAFCVESKVATHEVIVVENLPKRRVNKEASFAANLDGDDLLLFLWGDNLLVLPENEVSVFGIWNNVRVSSLADGVVVPYDFGEICDGQLFDGIFVNQKGNLQIYFQDEGNAEFEFVDGEVKMAEEDELSHIPATFRPLEELGLCIEDF